MAWGRDKGGGSNPPPKPERNTPRRHLCGCGQWYDPKNDAESLAHANHRDS